MMHHSTMLVLKSDRTFSHLSRYTMLKAHSLKESRHAALDLYHCLAILAKKKKIPVAILFSILIITLKVAKSLSIKDG